MINKSWTFAINGINPSKIEIEVNATKKGPENVINIIGLADTIIKESKERVKSAILASKLSFPHGKTTISLAPANLHKKGSHFDLPIAITILSCQYQLNQNIIKQSLFLGELSLDGNIRGIKGALVFVIEAYKQGFKNVIIPKDNIKEVSVFKGINIYSANNLQEVLQFSQGKNNLTKIIVDDYNLNKKDIQNNNDFKYIKGQQQVRRGLEIAAAGKHNIILLGPPGCGKTMMANAFCSILPDLSNKEILETTQIYSVAGLLDNDYPLINTPPIRTPHHSISDIGLIGGTSNLTPGEISLAHNGVLFLDEIPEFKRSAIETLRQPLEKKKITISRASGTSEFPADFIFFAAMNPSKSGYQEENFYRYSSVKNKYLEKISGPLLDRIDIHMQVPALKEDELISKKYSEDSLSIKKRVINARQIQRTRFKDKNYCTNSDITVEDMDLYCCIDKESTVLLKKAIIRLNLSARAKDKIIKIARTIADLDNEENIKYHHVAEAVQYRCLDRQ